MQCRVLVHCTVAAVVLCSVVCWYTVQLLQLWNAVQCCSAGSSLCLRGPAHLTPSHNMQQLPTLFTAAHQVATPYSLHCCTPGSNSLLSSLTAAHQVATPYSLHCCTSGSNSLLSSLLHTRQQLPTLFTAAHQVVTPYSLHCCTPGSNSLLSSLSHSRQHLPALFIATPSLQ